MDFGKTEKTFYFDYTTMLGRRYEGNFTVKCLLNMGEKHRMELERARLLGNNSNPTNELLGLAIIFSTLRAKIVDAPNWWTQSRNGETLQEEDLLGELFAKVDDAEIAWRKEFIESTQQTIDQQPQS
jgi:hypothetical protein